MTNPRFDYFNRRVVLNQKRNPSCLINPCIPLSRMDNASKIGCRRLRSTLLLRSGNQLVQLRDFAVRQGWEIVIEFTRTARAVQKVTVHSFKRCSKRHVSASLTCCSFGVSTSSRARVCWRRCSTSIVLPRMASTIAASLSNISTHAASSRMRDQKGLKTNGANIAGLRSQTSHCGGLANSKNGVRRIHGRGR